jgi:hypothetical protein
MEIRRRGNEGGVVPEQRDAVAYDPAAPPKGPGPAHRDAYQDRDPYQDGDHADDDESDSGTGHGDVPAAEPEPDDARTDRPDYRHVDESNDMPGPLDAPDDAADKPAYADESNDVRVGYSPDTAPTAMPGAPAVTPVDTGPFGAEPETVGAENVRPENVGADDGDVIAPVPGTPVESSVAGSQGWAPDWDADELRRRWHDIQASFVDDPRDSVEKADNLVEEAVSSLTTRKQELMERWKTNDQGDTEQLRLALRDYRSLLERLTGPFLQASDRGVR